MTAKITTSAEELVRALKKIGAPQQAAHALVLGAGPDLADAVARLLKPRALTVRQDDDAFDLDAETGLFQLVIAGQGLEAAFLSGVRSRLQAIARVTADDGYIGLWIATLAAADAGAGYQALLFPNSAAAGELGAAALATTPLSASTWMLMARACGLEIVSCQGFGKQPLPDDLASHASRLSIYDPLELTSGRLLMILRKMEGRR